MTARISSLAATLALAIPVALTVFVAAPAQAQTLSILHSFTGGGDGGQLRAPEQY
jgi:hypothetical protein